MSEEAVKIGKFRIVEKIGRGSMATVYRAYDPYMDRTVAIKVTDPQSISDERTRRRLVELFFAEAKIYGMLDHRNILPVYDAGEDEDRYYLVMEYIEQSRTLLSFCRPGNLLAVPRAVELLHQCCKGLRYAHSRNVVHLDVKPNNIMLTPDDVVKLSDFGIAKMLDPEADYLAPESLLGTPTYIAPERLRKEPVNHQADIYSLGVVMYYVLTGRLPFSGPDLKELLRQILHDEPSPLRQHRPEVPELLEPIVRKAMARDRDERYQSAADMAADLHAFHKKIVHAVVTAEVGMREKLDKLTKLPFFRDFFEIELTEVVSAGDWLEYPAGRVILDEGDLEESFSVIVEGEVSVVESGNVIAALRPGDCFGEMAYVARRPRTVAIRAATDAVVLKINNELLEKTSVYCQLKFTRLFLDTLIGRLSGRKKND